MPPRDFRIVFHPSLDSNPRRRINAGSLPMATENEKTDAPRPLGEIAQGPSAFEQFLDRNQKNLIILSVVIALAIAIYLVVQGIARSKERTAGAELFKAADLPSLQKIVNDYKGTAASGSAAIALAERQWTDSQQEAAIETLRTFITTQPDHPAKPTAQTSLANKLRAQGKADEARKLLEEVADDPAAAHLAPYALICLGDLSKAAGNLDEAEKSYQKAKTNFPGNSFNPTIDQRLNLLKAQTPTEIDPPPAPTPPATPDTPATPTAPGAPAAPSVPSTPAAPSVPGVPASPGLPGTPIPGLPPADSNPDADVPEVNNPFINPPATPAAPVEPETKDAPPTGPAEEASPEPPASGDSPAEPAPEGSPAPPAGENPPQDPAAEPRNDPPGPATEGSPAN